MTRHLGTFHDARWGEVEVHAATYGSANGPLAVLLRTASGEPLTTLSANLYKPECSYDSRDLPWDCFYVKAWSENAELAETARHSGLFIERPDLGTARSGFVTCPVWQIRGE